MAVRRVVLSVAAVFALGLSALPMTATAEEAPQSSKGDRSAVVPDQPAPIARGIIVQTTTSAPSDAALEATDDALGLEADVASDAKVTGKISTIDFDETVPEDVASEVAAEVQARADVVWATPNTLVRPAAVPFVYMNDPALDRQWNLADYSAPDDVGYSINVRSLWRKTLSSSDVRVAIVDTGITTHPELDPNRIVPGYDMVGPDDPRAATKTYKAANDGDGRDPNPADPGDWTTAGQCGRGSPASPSSWHGTSIAGVIGATTNNGDWIAGIAPKASIQPVRVLGRCGGWDSDIIAGITWASGGSVAGVPENENPSQIVNLSFGQMFSTATKRNSACKAYAAASAAGRARGAVFIASAGNHGGNANLAVPASCPGYISVGATGRKGFSATYSNIGSSVDLVAPGGDSRTEYWRRAEREKILSLSNVGKKGPVNSDNGGSALLEGTSLAAAEVSGGAALIYTLLHEAGEPIVEDGTTVGWEVPSASQVEAAIYASVSPFRPRNSVWAKKKVLIGNYYYIFDLNCAGHNWCGRGTFNLGRVQTPLSLHPYDDWFFPAINEPLKAPYAEWNSDSKLHYQWMRNGEPVGTDSSQYTPTVDDVGASLWVVVRPATAAFASFKFQSRETTVKAGPVVTMTTPDTSIAYGEPFTASVEVTPRTGAGPLAETVNEGDGVTILNSGYGMTYGTLVDGKVELEVTPSAWNIGTNKIWAKYGGSDGGGVTWPASSEHQLIEVRKASSSITTQLPTSVRSTAAASLELEVIVPYIPHPDGTLYIYIDGKKVKRTALWEGKFGKRTVVLPKLAKGRHLVKVVYVGTSKITGVTSTTKSIRSY